MMEEIVVEAEVAGNGLHTDETAEEQGAVTSVNTPIVVTRALPEGFMPVESGKMMWSPRLCLERGQQDDLLAGYVLDYVTLGADSQHSFKAFLIQLTRECLCVDRVGNPVRVNKGDEIFVKDSYEFEPWQVWANHPQMVAEIAAIPLGERDWEGGDRSFTYLWGVGAPKSRAEIAPKTLARFHQR